MTKEQTQGTASHVGQLSSSFSPSWVEDQTPHTSLVIACYKVAAYLPDFFASLEAQTSNHAGTELIFIIDGCPENSEALVREWMQRSDYPVHLITKPNGGAATARNAGLAVARGTWVACPDPDDVLEPDFLHEIERARSTYPNETMFVGRICLIAPDGSAIEHPLDYKNRDGQTRVVDLHEDPDALVTQGAVTFLNTAHLRSHSITMREDLATGEDTDLIVHYLLAVKARYVLVPEARYRYQRRADESSIVKTQEKNIDRYRVLFGSSYPALLDQAGPNCPQWLANMLLYFVFYLFDRNRNPHSAVYATDDATLTEIREALRVILKRIGVKGIDAFRVHNLPLDMRTAWIAGAASDNNSSVSLPAVAVERHDYNEARTTLRVSFASVAEDPPVSLHALDSNTGDQLEIVARKTRAIEYLGATWAYEHILLVRTERPDAVRLVAESGTPFALNGAALPVWAIRDQLGHSKPPMPNPQHDRPRDQPQALTRRVANRLRQRLRRLKYALPQHLARTTGRARRYQSAVLFDLSSGSHNEYGLSLEGLFTSAVADPHTNAWGLVSADDPRVATLRAAKLPVVIVGSSQHLVLLARTAVVVSLRRDYPQPFPADILAKRWRFVYLPPVAPGTHDYWDLFPWEIDRIAADSKSENEVSMLAEDGGYYWFNQCEVMELYDYRTALSKAAPKASEVAPPVRFIWAEAQAQGVMQ